MVVKINHAHVAGAAVVRTRRPQFIAHLAGRCMRPTAIQILHPSRIPLGGDQDHQSRRYEATRLCNQVQQQHTVWECISEWIPKHCVGVAKECTNVEQECATA